MFEKNPWKRSYSNRAACGDPTEGELLKSFSIDMYLSRLVDCNLMTDIVHRISCHQPLPEASSRYSSPAIRSNPTAALALSSVHPTEESLWISMDSRTPERSSSGYRAFQSPDPGTGQRHTKRLSYGYQPSYSHDIDLVQESPVKSEKPNKTTRRFSYGNPGSLYPRHITYPSSKRSQPECIDVGHLSTNSTNQKSTYHCDTSGASKLYTHNNLRGIETNRGEFQNEQQDLIGQSLGYTHFEQQPDFHTLLHARTSHILDASPAELSVYPASHQDARKQSEQFSTQSYLFSSGRKGTSVPSEMALQAITKAKSSLLVTVEEQPSSEKYLQYAKSDIDQEQKDNEDAELNMLCRRRGQWPCKLRPLIKKSTLMDIHTTLRRNLKLPAGYYIDIEFQWQGNTYMILDATHWQWAREQVNHGDMAIRCNIWQKRYTR
ncbi:hypothetical protein BG005_006269 [Podila minutissima]|nr:hypothetical protein BG005_006269 [Podila minutissima]